MIRQGCVNAVVVVLFGRTGKYAHGIFENSGLVNCQVLTAEPVDLLCLKSRTNGLELPSLGPLNTLGHVSSQSQLTHAEAREDLNLWYFVTDGRLSTPDCSGMLCFVDYQVPIFYLVGLQCFELMTTDPEPFIFGSLECS